MFVTDILVCCILVSGPSKFPWTWGCLVNLTCSREYYLVRLRIIMLTCERIYIFFFLWLLKKIILASIQGDITMSNHLLKEKTNGNFSAVYFQKLSCFDRSLSFFLTLVESNLKKKCFASHLLHFVRKTKSICKGHELSEWLHMNSPSTLLVLSSWLLTVHRSCCRVSKY